jgi:hypothetical protein
MVGLGLLSRLFVLIQQGVETDHSFARLVGHTTHLSVVCELIIFSSVHSWDYLYGLLLYDYWVLWAWRLLGAHIEVEVQQADFSLGLDEDGFRLFGYGELDGGRFGWLGLGLTWRLLF